MNLYVEHDNNSNLGWTRGKRYIVPSSARWRMQQHSFNGCTESDAFDDWSKKDRAHLGHFGVVEEDIGNPDDKVAKWKFVPTNVEYYELRHEKGSPYQYTKYPWQLRDIDLGFRIRPQQ